MRNSSIVYGIHAVHSVISLQPELIQYIVLSKGKNSERVHALLDIAREKSIPIKIMEPNEFEALVGCSSNDKKVHQNIAVKCLKQILQNKQNKEEDLFTLIAKLPAQEAEGEIPLLLALDGVQDPHNLGACLRSAAAFGVHAVIIPKDRSVGITDVVRKVASGASEIVPVIQVTNLARTLQDLKLKNIWVFGATEEADTVLYDADLTGPLIIVLGAEGQGMRRLTKEHCDQLLKIPISKDISSVNVSVAAGIFLSEITRQRRRAV